MKKRMFGFVIVAVFTLATGSVFAQNVEYKNKTYVDFEDLVIEGEIKKPTTETIFELKPRKFDSLVKVRKNFENETSKSAGELD